MPLKQKKKHALKHHRAPSHKNQMVGPSTKTNKKCSDCSMKYRTRSGNGLCRCSIKVPFANKISFVVVGELKMSLLLVVVLTVSSQTTNGTFMLHLNSPEASETVCTGRNIDLSTVLSETRAILDRYFKI